MMLEQKTTDFLEALSSAQPVPGGGGACAAVGAFSSALGMMVANLTVGKKRYASVEAEIVEARNRLERLRNQLVELTDRDAQAFSPLAKAYSLPKETKEQQEEKTLVMEAALHEASIVPLEIMKTVFQTAEVLEILGEKGSRLALSDVGVGILFARAALEGASLNIYINTKMMKDRERAESLNQEADGLIAKMSQLQERVYKGVLENIR